MFWGCARVILAIHDPYHDYKSLNFDIFSNQIILEDKVWIATDVFVGPGVTIGFGSVVSARSSVYKDLPPLMIWRGNPVQPIRYRLE